MQPYYWGVSNLWSLFKYLAISGKGAPSWGFCEGWWALWITGAYFLLQGSFKFNLFLFLTFYVHECISCMCVNTPAEVRRRCQIPVKIFWWLLATMWVLGSNLGPMQEQSRLLTIESDLRTTKEFLIGRNLWGCPLDDHICSDSRWNWSNYPAAEHGKK